MSKQKVTPLKNVYDFTSKDRKVQDKVVPKKKPYVKTEKDYTEKDIKILERKKKREKENSK